jgi:hypothetical protein
MRKFTEADDQLIQKMLPTHTHTQIAERLGWTTENAVRKRCQRRRWLKEHTVVWTPERDAELIRLRNEQLTFSEVSRILHSSRSACIARASRLGLKNTRPARLNFRAKSGRGLNAAQKINRARSRAKTGLPRFKAEAIPELPITAYFRGVTLLDLEPNQCRYPQGDAPDILFCGMPAVPETSWCVHCSKIVYQPLRQRNISVAERFRRLRQGKRNYKQQQARAA